MLSSQKGQSRTQARNAATINVCARSKAQHSWRNSEIGGRFAQVGAQNVVGQEAVPNYPAASSPWQIQLPNEPPLGYRVNDLTPHELEPSIALASPAEAQAGEPASDRVPSDPLLDVEQRDVGSPHPFRRF
jgi:hypothetical protein